MRLMMGMMMMMMKSHFLKRCSLSERLKIVKFNLEKICEIKYSVPYNYFKSTFYIRSIQPLFHYKTNYGLLKLEISE